MPKCVMVIPWDFVNGAVSLPGLTAVEVSQVSYTCGSYVPPPPGTAPYALVWLTAPQSIIDKLSARADCLYICAVMLDAQGQQVGFETASINATARSAVRTKIAAMGFTGDKYGLLAAAINASQQRDELAFQVAMLAFFRDAKAEMYMTKADFWGTV